MDSDKVDVVGLVGAYAYLMLDVSRSVRRVRIKRTGPLCADPLPRFRSCETVRLGLSRAPGDVRGPAT